MQKHILFLFIECFFSASVYAQSSTYYTADLVHKEYNKTLFQAAPRIDLVFIKPMINVYLAGVINTEGAYKSFVENRQWYAQAGIDIGLTHKWYIGLSTKVNGGVSDFDIYNYTTKMYVQYRGKIGKLIFLKDLLYEYFNFSKNTEVNVSSTGVIFSRRSPEGRLGLGFGLGRYFALGENHIGVFLSYKSYVQFDFDDNGNSVYKNRFIDYTTFRMDVGYLINHALYIGFYTTRDTNYMYVPASITYNNNSITPIVGIACNVMLFTKPKNEKQLSSFRYFYTQ